LLSLLKSFRLRLSTALPPPLQTPFCARQQLCLPWIPLWASGKWPPSPLSVKMGTIVVLNVSGMEEEKAGRLLVPLHRVSASRWSPPSRRNLEKADCPLIRQ